MKTRSISLRIEHTHSRTLKVGYISGRDGQAVHEACGCYESITIGARRGRYNMAQPIPSKEIHYAV